MNEYKCEWNSFEYGDDVEDQYESFDFFTESIGYDKDDQETISKLELGECCYLGFGGHKITRLK